MPTESEVVKDGLDTMIAYLRWCCGGVADPPLPSFREQKIAVIQRAFSNFTAESDSDEALQGRFELAVEKLSNSSSTKRNISSTFSAPSP